MFELAATVHGQRKRSRQAPGLGSLCDSCIAVQRHQGLHQALVRARADTHYDGLIAVLRHVGMTHVAVYVDRLAGLQDDWIVELGVDGDGALEYVDEFLPRVMNELPDKIIIDRPVCN